MGSGFNSITFNMTFASTAGAADNKGKFLFYYYPGGFDGFMQEVNKNLVYPESALQSKIEGVIKVNCRINNELRLVPLKSLNDPDDIFSSEAFRVINLAPAFKEELRSSSFMNDTLPVSIIFVLDKRHQWGKSAQTDEERADGFFDEGVYVFNKGKYLNSIEYFNSAIKTYSLHAKAFYNRGVALLKLNDNSGACEDFKTAFLLGDLSAVEAIKQTCK
jgi:tetratricopeptide (TPR) repeat protein